MFKSMDTDNSGTITFEELKAGLPKLGSKLSESEVRQLMEANTVRIMVQGANLKNMTCLSLGVLNLAIVVPQNTYYDVIVLQNINSLVIVLQNTYYDVIVLQNINSLKVQNQEF
ncbi:Calcium-dependent protein kinase isoform 2 [Glycine soja]|uniref:Calcium-dependent protein kinase isoform 2 n=1 Tax=Glycine soja TaxID=3848 RepID=A0A0B2R9M8_GLYSO|nr:Calcium-dependent protein kinase isoform 2 [Glycine soja]